MCSSGVSTVSRLAKTPRPMFCSGFPTSIAEKATSADVKGLPSCQFTPSSRRENVTVLPSAEPSHPVARERPKPIVFIGGFSQRLDDLRRDKEHSVRSDYGRVELAGLAVGGHDEALPSAAFTKRGSAVARSPAVVPSRVRREIIGCMTSILEGSTERDACTRRPKTHAANRHCDVTVPAQAWPEGSIPLACTYGRADHSVHRSPRVSRAAASISAAETLRAMGMSCTIADG